MNTLKRRQIKSRIAALERKMFIRTDAIKLQRKNKLALKEVLRKLQELLDECNNGLNSP